MGRDLGQKFFLSAMSELHPRSRELGSARFGDITRPQPTRVFGERHPRDWNRGAARCCGPGLELCTGLFASELAVDQSR
jgi:hypothetical protein